MLTRGYPNTAAFPGSSIPRLWLSILILGPGMWSDLPSWWFSFRPLALPKPVTSLGFWRNHLLKFFGSGTNPFLSLVAFLAHEEGKGHMQPLASRALPTECFCAWTPNFSCQLGCLLTITLQTHEYKLDDSIIFEVYVTSKCRDHKYEFASYSVWYYKCMSYPNGLIIIINVYHMTSCIRMFKISVCA